MPVKKLYNKRGKVHPSLSSPPSIDDYLALLPSAILTLITALSDEDKRVLAYLISWSKNNNSSHQENGGFSAKSGKDGHGHAFNCDCFECYMTFWARWNSSPNRQLIHDVLEAYEEDLAKKNKAKNGKMKRRKNNKSRLCDEPIDNPGSGSGSVKEEKNVQESADLRGNIGAGDEEQEDGEVGTEKGTCRRLFNFIGEKISGFWNMG